MTIIRLCCILLILFTTWIIISPVENHSANHWDLIAILLILTALLITADYFLKKRIPNQWKLSLTDILLLVVLTGIWIYFFA